MDKSTRCFDLLCTGKVTSERELKLNIQPAKEIPQLITKNANGEVVYKEPEPMCTIQSPKGHNIWVNIELKTITTSTSDCMCLGIKKRGEEGYYDVLYSGNLSRYVDVQEDDIVELIPLISASKLPTYSPVKMGDLVTNTESTYDFGSVYRVNITLSKERWILQSCDLHTTYSNNQWNNFGGIGIGSIIDKSNRLHENQLVAINWFSGLLAHSSDGIHWNGVGKIGDSAGNQWDAGVAYGNGIWCAVNWDNSRKIRRSLDNGKTWLETLSAKDCPSLKFYDGNFVMVTRHGIIYSSPDAEIWTQTSQIEDDDFFDLMYGDNKWLCISTAGKVYCSEDINGSWVCVSDDLFGMDSIDKLGNKGWSGDYINGYFYVIRMIDGSIARSLDGSKWEKIFTPAVTGGYPNITFYKNKLYALKIDGKNCFMGLFNPDGTI